MNGAGWFTVGALVGVAVMTRVIPANTSSCCERLAFAARDKIASYAGPFDELVKGAIDAIGLTPHIPALLDIFGVPRHD